MIKICIFSTLTILLLSGCKVPLAEEIKSTQYFECLSSANDFSACCLGRGGGQTCTAVPAGYYFRSADKLLVCGDGDASSACYQF